MKGIFGLMTFLRDHGKTDRVRTVWGDVDFAPETRGGAILVGGPRLNPTTRRLLPTLQHRFEFIKPKDRRLPKKIRSRKRGLPWMIRDSETGRIYRRGDPPDADYALIVKATDGRFTHIVLAGIGARSTRAACNYIVHASDVELARHAMYSCVVRSSLDNETQMAAREVCQAEPSRS